MSFAPPPTPYPPDRYTAAAGENTAWIRRADTPPELRAGGGSADYLVTGAQTHGDFGLYRWNMAPKQAGPDEHFHRAISESFYVLSGTITICTGSAWVDAQVGDFVHVPVGGVHGFRNDSDAAASMLILFAPGAPRERYFEGLVELRTMRDKPTEEEMAEFYARHDTYWL